MFLISVPPQRMGEIVTFFTFPLELSSAETFIDKTDLCLSRWLGNQEEGVKRFSYTSQSAGVKLQRLGVQVKALTTRLSRTAEMLDSISFPSK